MKKVVVVLTAILSSCAFAGQVEYSAEIAEPAVSASGELSSDLLYVMQEPGKPRLPYERCRLVSPHGESIKSIDLKLEGLCAIDGDSMWTADDFIDLNPGDSILGAEVILRDPPIENRRLITGSLSIK